MVEAATAPQAKKLGGAFNNLFVSNLATNLGDGVIRTAAPLLAVRLTHDPLLISLIAALALLPWLFFAIPAGILVDRIDRRLSLGMANGVRVVLATALVVLYATDSLTIWALYIVIFVDGICETVYDGSIRAMVPSLVAKPLLPAANSRIEAGEVVLQNFVAAPYTSLLFAVAVLIPLGTNIGFYAVAVVLALLLPRAASGKQFTAVSTEPRTRWYRQFVDGYHFIMSNRMLRTLWFFSTFIGICFSAATAGLVLFLFQREGLPQALFGVFMLTGAVGGILGSVFASRLKSLWGAGLTMAIANLVSCAALVLVGAVQSIWVAAFGFFLTSFTVLIWNVLVMSLRQSVIPGRMLGRVHGTWRTLLWGTMPLGSLIGGLLGRVDLALPFLLAGGASTLASVVFFRFLGRLPNPEDVDNGDIVTTELGPGGVVIED
ncbi:MAG TPA: MFS transporter [Galbitalea sp.]|jgi:Na+/melibiose symporter-like transporter